MTILEPNPGHVPVKNLRKSVVAGSIGVLVHWFDWAVYAYTATTIAGVFFPEQDSTASLLAVFGVFAISFIVRPIGAFLFGEVGDRFGRKITLSIVILLMAASTLVIGVLPGYKTIGLWAPVLLIMARVIQGLAAGGEFGSAATFLAEYSPKKHRGFGVSWLEVGALLGFLLASFAAYLLNTILTQDQLTSWGWRIPFLVAAPLGVIGFYIRTHIEDTPEFTVMKETTTETISPTVDLLKNNLKELFQMIGIQIMEQVTFYIVLVYLLTYQEVQLNIPASTAAVLSSLASIVGVIVVPIAGTISDRIGRKPILITVSLMTIILPLPMFEIMRKGTTSAAAATMLLGLILAIQLGVHAVVSAELFPTRNRQTGLSIGYSLVSALFAGTSPYLLTFLINKTHNIDMPAYYLIVVGIIGLIISITLKETKGVDLISNEEREGIDLAEIMLHHQITNKGR